MEDNYKIKPSDVMIWIGIVIICSSLYIMNNSAKTLLITEGVIEDQFNLIKDYNLLTGGPSFWAWNHNYYSPYWNFICCYWSLTDATILTTL